MICTVNHILESLCNPEGRFRTLQGVVLNDPSSPDPVFTYGGEVVSFKVRWKNRSYLLKCFLNHSERLDTSLQRVSSYLAGFCRPELIEYRYFSGELLVFDDLDRSCYIDVVLMHRPRGQLLDAYLAQAASRRDIPGLKTVMRSFCALGASLLSREIVHGNIKPANVLVLPAGGLKLLNYERMQVPGMDTFADKINEDNMAVANLVVGLTVLASTPAAFRALSGDSMLRLPVLRSPLLALLAEQAERSDCLPVQCIVELLLSSNYTLRDRRTLIGALERLADDTVCIPPPLSGKAIERLSFPAARSGPNAKKEAGPYDWKGPLREGLCCVERDGRWGFVDKREREVIPLRYSWADDFCGERVVVRLDEGFALLDKTGREVLPPVFESLDWNPEYGLVQAAFDGRVGLFDGEGKEILPIVYDWIGPVGPLTLVRREGRCGYIRPDGELVIPLHYEDAFDFNAQGAACVMLEGRTFHIDAAGGEVSPG